MKKDLKIRVMQVLKDAWSESMNKEIGLDGEKLVKQKKKTLELKELILEFNEAK
jgi:hypothetical protein